MAAAAAPSSYLPLPPLPARPYEPILSLNEEAALRFAVDDVTPDGIAETRRSRQPGSRSTNPNVVAWRIAHESLLDKLTAHGYDTGGLSLRGLAYIFNRVFTAEGDHYSMVTCAADLGLKPCHLDLLKSGLLLATPAQAWALACRLLGLPAQPDGEFDSERRVALQAEIATLAAELGLRKTHNPAVARCMLRPEFAGWMQMLDLSVKHVDTLMCDSVAGCLWNPEFRAALQTWRCSLDPALFTALMTNSVARRLLEAGYQPKMHGWLKYLGPKLFVNFMRGVGAHLGTFAFDASLSLWRPRLSKSAFAHLFGNASVSFRMSDPAFPPFLEVYFELLGEAEFLRLMGYRSGIPARFVALSGFANFLSTWDGKWTAAMSTQLCNRVACDQTTPVSSSVFEAIARHGCRRCGRPQPSPVMAQGRARSGGGRKRGRE